MYKTFTPIFLFSLESLQISFRPIIYKILLKMWNLYSIFFFWVANRLILDSISEAIFLSSSKSLGSK